MKNKFYFISILFVAVVAMAGLFSVAIPASADFEWVYPGGSSYPTTYTSCGYACSSYDWTYPSSGYSDYYYTDYYYDDYYYDDYTYPTYTPTYTYPTYDYYYVPTYTYNPPVYTPPPAQPTCTIYGSPNNIQSGSSATLSWSASNASSAFVDNGVGTVSATYGSRTVNPTFTTTYTMTVSGQGGSAVCQTTVVVQQAQVPSCTISASPSSINSGDSASITWSSQNATSVNISNIGSVSNTGSRSVSPTNTTTYTMTVNGQGGSATCQTTVVVQQAQTPSCTLNISPNNINQGNSATLSWSSNNASSISIDHGIGNVNTGSGSRSVNPSNSTTYTATAYGQNGQSVTCQTTVTVNNNQGYQPWCTITASSNSVGQGQNTVLSWTTSNNATSFTINPGVGSVSTGSGSRVVYPNTTTTYTGFVYGQNGQSATCQTVVGAYAASNVSLFQQPGDQPLAFVSLNQVPYTGFEAGPVVTFIFWLVVAAWSFGLAYIFMGARGLQFIAERAFGYKPATVEYANMHLATAPAVEYGTREDEYVDGFDSAPETNFTPSTINDSEQDLRGIIEARANAVGVLLSPEAAKMAISLRETRSETLNAFGTILDTVIETLPREDGWILLSSDRFEAIAGKSKTAPIISSEDLSV